MFTVSFSELESRLEPEYYTPDLRNLENIVRKQSDHKLRHYIRGISSGATPSTTQPKKYYTDKENGYPFLRVQNLQINGKLNFNNLKYINEKTHNGKLQRSQVEEGDLLIKITGVGRMAIASVAPEGFVGNTNQHMVVVKTESRGISEYLANYLNLDLVETLASRRATGATRPALDYQALKSIPIIEGLDFGIIEEAYQTKAQKEAEAKELLNSIDDYLLSELGIEVPEKDNSLTNRIFTTSFQNIAGRRYDPKPYDNHSQDLFDAVANADFQTVPLKELVINSKSGKWGKNTNSKVDLDKYQKCLVVRATEFDNLYNLKLENDRAKYRFIKKRHLKKMDIQKNDLLVEKSGGSPDQPVGRIAILRKDIVENNTLCYSNFINKFRIDSTKAFPEYLFSFLKTIHNIKVTEIMQSQTSGIRNLIMDEYFNQDIVLPDLAVQKKIAQKIKDRRQQAKELEKEAERAVEEARRQVEEMILEEDSVSA
jgi:restriction endonuclease S subunit